ncbi:MAG: hypothetical protein JNK82_21865, partial [Myxococcaceae bacterium]|nr:hypothetical protein [Myxococcaceae bacterium]
ACLTVCDDNSDCLNSHYCQNPGASGFCTPKIADSQPCVNAGDCVSGTCLTGYIDGDNDNYGAGTAARFCTILPTTPTKYVATAGDCCDSNNQVRPNQTMYFETPIPGACSSLGFNYDCSTNGLGNPTITHQYQVNGCTGYTCSGAGSSCSNLSGLPGQCTTSTGWSTSTFPGCGFTGTLRTCSTFQITCGSGNVVCGCNTPTITNPIDRCR